MRHRKMITTNMAMMVAEGRQPNEVFAYADMRLPLSAEGSIKGESEKQGDPLVRCYCFVYEPSESALLPLVNLEVVRQQQLLKTLMGRALTAADTKTIMLEAANL